ncbi:hypothetical protein C484_18077 [Natrialba taiwanensis DSM 12281]|uniref:Uncharacterized protein n=2 Tax=Natrialba taiwanensis TaxID=160846 RepID=L9ZLR8_9EURY|nr:hypothetical protein C484_18077 [Natrialba taiwanensis DSM 12281]
MWMPQKMTLYDMNYAHDNGAYGGHFDGDVWVSTLERALTEMPTEPDFVVLPDVPGDAKATIETHREWLYDRPLCLGAGEVMRYWVLQPGLPIGEQFDAVEGCQGVFVGGSKRWLRAHGEQIVAEARERDLRAHVGNPGGKNGLVWAYRTGFDSCDTTTIFQNGYWHYLDRLEDATEETGSPDPEPGEPGSQQATVTEWSA